MTLLELRNFQMSVKNKATGTPLGMYHIYSPYWLIAFSNELIGGTIYLHRRGASSAARLGDEVNPNRESSGSQFYIVWGKTYKQNELKQMEKQMGIQMEQTVFNQLAKEHHDEIMNFRRNRDREGLMKLQDQLVDETKKLCKEQGYPKFTDEQVKAYTEVGGTPFLDNQYTVFGEVEEGLDVVEKIQNCETIRGDRPKEDISMEISVIEE